MGGVELDEQDGLSSMLAVRFEQLGLRHVLCLGAHSDDLEIGCGGTVLRLMEAPNPPSVTTTPAPLVTSTVVARLRWLRQPASTSMRP